MARRIQLGLLAGVLTAVVLVGWPDKPQQAAVNHPSSLPAASLADAALATSAAQQPLPASLSGTEHGVRLFSVAGELVLSSGLRDVFDYYLSALGELPLSDIRPLVEQALARQLTARPLAQAMAIYDDYLSYRQALQAFDLQYATQPQASAAQRLQQLQQRQQALILLQDQLLGVPVATLFFARDRQLDEYTLARAGILQADLSVEQRAQALMNLQSGLPAEVQAQRQRNQQQASLLQIANSDVNAAQKYQQRAEVAGDQVAQRLAQLDQQQQDWQQRLQQLRQQLEELQQAGLAPDDYQQAQQRLLQQTFEPHEQLRARVLLAR